MVAISFLLFLVIKYWVWWWGGSFAVRDEMLDIVMVVPI